MNVKTFFIAAILSLVCFPLYAQTESADEGQKYYEMGMKYWNKMLATDSTESVLRDLYKEKAFENFNAGAGQKHISCVFMLGEYNLHLLRKESYSNAPWEYPSYKAAKKNFSEVEKYYAELFITAEDEGDLQKAAEYNAKMKEAIDKNNEVEEVRHRLYDRGY